MAKTCLNGINDVLTNTGWVDSQNLLASLTDSGKQIAIDQALQAWNQVIQEMFRQAGRPSPTGAGTDTITLATGTREYTLPTGFLQMEWPLINETNGHTIQEYKGGFEKMRVDQPIPANYTGQPLYACINPATGKLRLDTAPTANENGDEYTALFSKSQILSAAADAMPFNDDVYQALIQTVSEYFRAIRNSDPDFQLSQINFSRAIEYLDGNFARTKW